MPSGKSRDKYTAREAYSRQEAVDSYDAARFSSPGGKLFDAIEKEFVLSNLPAENEILVLEVGTGTGRFTIEVAKRRLDIVACDISIGMLHKTKEKLLAAGLEGKVALINSDIYHLPFKNKTFGYVICLRVIPNLGSKQNEEEALKELCRVCRYGATVVFDFVNLHSFAILNRGIKPALSSVNEMKRCVSNIPSVSISHVEGRRLIPQTLFELSPRFLLKSLGWLDAKLSSLLPNFAGRIFVVLKIKEYPKIKG